MSLQAGGVPYHLVESSSDDAMAPEAIRGKWALCIGALYSEKFDPSKPLRFLSDLDQSMFGENWKRELNEEDDGHPVKRPLWGPRIHPELVIWEEELERPESAPGSMWLDRLKQAHIRSVE